MIVSPLGSVKLRTLTGGKTMIAGTKTLKTYWVDKEGESTRREVILDGSCGDKCGYVRLH